MPCRPGAGLLSTTHLCHTWSPSASLSQTSRLALVTGWLVSRLTNPAGLFLVLLARTNFAHCLRKSCVIHLSTMMVFVIHP